MAKDDALEQRLPPHDRDAERSVLGSMLRDNSVIGDVLQILRADNFYSDAHQKIFNAVVSLYDRGHPAAPGRAGPGVVHRAVAGRQPRHPGPARGRERRRRRRGLPRHRARRPHRAGALELQP